MNTGDNDRAYLLRLWRVTDTQWRASLGDLDSCERLAFPTLEQLVTYLAGATQAGFPSVRAENGGESPCAKRRPMAGG